MSGTRPFSRVTIVVLLHRSCPEGLETPCLTVDSKAGARKLVDHLLEVHGSRRIAFLSGPPGNGDFYWRQRGHRESLKGHNIPLDPALLILACGFWAVALVLTTGYYFVYPPEARRLREGMQERRQIIERERL